MKITKTIAISLLCLTVSGATAYGAQSGLTAASTNYSTITQSAAATADADNTADAASGNTFQGLTTLIDMSSLFTERDLEQPPEVSPMVSTAVTMNIIHIGTIAEMLN